MPQGLDSHHASEIVKLLYLGDSGSGKTGSLASLANAGYNLRIQDYDNGLDVLHQYVNPEHRANIVFETLTDRYKATATGQIIPAGTPQAFVRGMRLLDRWKTQDYDLGGIATWGSQDILVIDSATLLGRCALNHIKGLNNATMEPDWGFYGQAMELEEAMLCLLFDASIKCNIIVTAHIVSIAPKKQVEVGVKPDGKAKVATVETGEAKAYPSFLGNKLPPRVGRFFNGCIRAKTRGNRRVIETLLDNEIELKNPAPKVVPAELEIGTGLAVYFEKVREAARPRSKA